MDDVDTVKKGNPKIGQMRADVAVRKGIKNRR
jgi:hypothetical protein